ncbi:MAG: hypothetical protein E7658_02355 [Ruminococcaceae bacterium]|nr:hypothetical protein [Oscillospiraceae bacterium]
MTAEKNGIIKRSVALILILIMGILLLPVSADTPEDIPPVEPIEQPDRLPTNTPRPQIMLYAQTVTAESAALSAELYNNFLNCDPELFLLTETGIRNLGWYATATDAQQAYVQAYADAIAAGCETTDEKIYAVVEYVCKNIGYDNDYYIHHTKEYWEMALHPWNVLETGATVCEGYARVTAALLQCLGIPCVYVLAPNHAWNMAYNGERWMLIDTTWISGSTYEYGVLNKSDDMWMEWYDFTIEQANAEYSHTITQLPISISDGELTNFPYYTRQNHAVLPASVNTIKARITTTNGVLKSIYLPKSVTKIATSSFYYGNVLETVYYEGTEAAFSDITIENYNATLTACTDIRYLDEVSAPVLVSQPPDQYTGIGESVVLEAAVSGESDVLTYQWYETTARDNSTGKAISGAVNPIFRFTADTVGEKYYFLEVTRTNPLVSGTQSKSVRTTPCKVRVFEEKPSVVIRVGSGAVMYVLSVSKTVYIEGAGDVFVNWWDVPASSTVYIDKDITAIADGTLCFYRTKAVVVEEDNARYRSDASGALYDMQEGVMLIFPMNASTTELVVPEGIKTIPAEAIRGNVERLVLPGSLETIDGYLVENNHLTKIRFSSGNPRFYVDSYGALIDKIDGRIVAFASGATSTSKPLEQYIFPDGIRYLEDKAFMYAQIRSFVFNDDVIAIGEKCFYNNNVISTYEFPSTLKSIGNAALAYNQQLKEVYFRGDAPEEWGTEMMMLWTGYEQPVIYYSDTASGWSTPYWTHPDDSSTVYKAYPYDTGDISVISVGVPYTVYEQVVTVPNNGVVCRVGYLKKGVYTAVKGIKNSDGSYSFTIPDNRNEALVVFIGDVNGDGAVDLADTTALGKALLPVSREAHTELTIEQQFAADINLNGNLNSADKVLLSRSLLGKNHIMYKAFKW